MKQLTILFAIMAMSTTFGIAGCKEKPDGATKANPAKATQASDPAKPEAKAAAPRAASSDDLPPECTAYKVLIDKLATCEKMPQSARDSLKQAYEAEATKWANVPAEGQEKLGATCQQGADALTQAVAASCGW